MLIVEWLIQFLEAKAVRAHLMEVTIFRGGRPFQWSTSRTVITINTTSSGQTTRQNFKKTFHCVIETSLQTYVQTAFFKLMT
jgi:hypothetical protein